MTSYLSIHVYESITQGFIYINNELTWNQFESITSDTLIPIFHKVLNVYIPVWISQNSSWMICCFALKAGTAMAPTVYYDMDDGKQWVT